MGLKQRYVVDGKCYELSCQELESTTDELRRLHCIVKQENGVAVEYSLVFVQKKNPGSLLHLLVNNRMFSPFFDSKQRKIFVEGRGYVVQKAVARAPSFQKTSHDQHASSSTSARSKGVINSPLAGRIVRVGATLGDFVYKGQPLVVIESMKMENEICAISDGIIKTLFIALGNLVQPNQPLVEIEMKGGNGGKPQRADGEAAV